MSSKELAQITLKGVSTLQEKQSRKIANQQRFVNKITLILASLENYQPFYFNADFFPSFYNVKVSEKCHFKRKNAMVSSRPIGVK